ncbi:MAG: TetR/AcrR family transcriptional regulator [Anaerolineae bacterium]|nr:TetR/AcrR family transcriptional regulator [Anaerolineae bacterium]
MTDDEIELRILSAAARLIGHYGYEKTTIDEIARDAGVAKSTLYTRWKTKESLVYAVIWHETRLFMEDWLVRVEADPKGGTFAGLFSTALRAMQANSFILSIYGDNRRVFGRMLNQPQMRDIYRERREMIRYMLSRLQDVGAVRNDVDLELFSYVGVTIQYGLLNIGELIPDGETPSMDKVIDQMADMMTRYLEPPGGGDSEAGKAVIREFTAQIRERLKSFEARSLS